MSHNRVIAIFITALFTIPATIFLLKKTGAIFLRWNIHGVDVNKEVPKKIPEEGGIALAIPLSISLLCTGYLFRQTQAGMCIVCAMLLVAAIGLADRFRNFGPYTKLLLCAITGTLLSPLFFFHGGYSTTAAIMLILATAAVYSVTVNAYNLLAGFNGLESGVTVIASCTLAFYFYREQLFFESASAFMTMCSYTVFWFFNKYPAKVFPGDSGTFIPPTIFVGLSITSRDALPLFFVLAPHLLNVVIKFISTGVSSRSDHKPLLYKDGLLHLPERGYLSLIRLYLRSGPKHERQIVHFVYLLEIICCAALFIVP